MLTDIFQKPTYTILHTTIPCLCFPCQRANRQQRRYYIHNTTYQIYATLFVLSVLACQPPTTQILHTTYTLPCLCFPCQRANRQQRRYYMHNTTYHIYAILFVFSMLACQPPTTQILHTQFYKYHVFATLFVFSVLACQPPTTQILHTQFYKYHVFATLFVFSVLACQPPTKQILHTQYYLYHIFTTLFVFSELACQPPTKQILHTQYYIYHVFTTLFVFSVLACQPPTTQILPSTTHAADPLRGISMLAISVHCPVLLSYLWVYIILFRFLCETNT